MGSMSHFLVSAKWANSPKHTQAHVRSRSGLGKVGRCVPRPRETPLSLPWILPRTQQDRAKSQEGGATESLECGARRSTMRGRHQSGSQKVRGTVPSPKPRNAVTDTP